MLENGVKTNNFACDTIKGQIDSALDFLADWVFESSGSVSISNLEDSEFRVHS